MGGEMSPREEISQDRERRRERRARQAKGFSGTNVKTNDSGCKAGSRGKGREGTRLQGWLQPPPGRWQFLFIFVPSRFVRRGRGSPLLSFPFCSLLLSWILSSFLSGSLRSFLLSSLLPGSKIFFFFAPPNLWLVDLLREFFVINMDEGVFFYFISTQEIVVEVIWFERVWFDYE